MEPYECYLLLPPVCIWLPGQQSLLFLRLLCRQNRWLHPGALCNLTQSHAGKWKIHISILHNFPDPTIDSNVVEHEQVLVKFLFCHMHHSSFDFSLSPTYDSSLKLATQHVSVSFVHPSPLFVPWCSNGLEFTVAFVFVLW